MRSRLLPLALGLITGEDQAYLNVTVSGDTAAPEAGP